MSAPVRLDLLLVQQGLASTRAKAQQLISGGKVSVHGKVISKAGEKVSPDSTIALSEQEHPYVSRGGLKLAAALDHFGIEVRGLRVLDVGQSTGGFTHCLLLRGAGSVMGIDVGNAQLAPSLREDPRVAFIEKQDIRSLAPVRIAPPFPFFVVDLSFVSLSLILPVLPPFLENRATGVVLVKPQFEVGSDRIGSGGIVRDAAAREWAVARIRAASEANGFTVAGVLPCPVKGGDGNEEFLLWLERPSSETGN